MYVATLLSVSAQVLAGKSETCWGCPCSQQKSVRGHGQGLIEHQSLTRGLKLGRLEVGGGGVGLILHHLVQVECCKVNFDPDLGDGDQVSFKLGESRVGLRGT